MKVIFLDIDGVLNGGWHPQHGFDWALTGAIQNLNALVARTGAKVVISSAWRLEMNIEALRQVLTGWGADVEIVDVTPQIDVEQDGMLFPAARIVEIRAWLDNTKMTVTDFVVLDDNNITLDIDNEETLDPEIEFRFVQTDGTKGLSKANIDEAIFLLDQGFITDIPA